MGFIWSIVIGLLAGALAKLVMPGKDPGGCIVTMLLGVAGSLLFTFLGRALGWYRPDEAAGFLGAVVGAVLILAAYRFFIRRRRV